jgi:polysaccharide biosynthesis transport protein
MNTAQNAKLHLLDCWHVIRIRLSLVALIFSLVVITVSATTFLLPKEYVSYTTIEVEPTPAGIFASTWITDVNDPKFTQTQVEIIARKGVLYPVIQRLDLEKRWARQGKPLSLDAAYSKLHSMLQPTEIRKTNLIQISVYSTDPEEAALLANTVAQEYIEQRISDAQTVISKGLDQLRDEVARKERAVDEAYANALRLRTEARIIDPNLGSPDSGGRTEDSRVLADQQKANDSRSQIATLRSRLEQLDHLKSDDLTHTAGLLNLNDAILEQKLPQLSLYQSAIAEKAKLLNSGLGQDHPDVKAIQTQIDAIDQQLRQQIDSLRKDTVAQLSIAEKTASARYLDARYRYLQERKLLDAAKARLTRETTERTMPQKPAKIQDRAEPSTFPVRPNILFNLLLGTLAGLVLSVTFAFFLEYLDTSVKTVDEVEKLVDLPVLAVIPKGIHISPQTPEDSPDTEAYRILKTNVDFARQKVAASTMSVVSGGPSEGKSTVVSNLGAAYAASGQQTLIIDCDLRRPAQHELFALDNRAGLNGYLNGEVALDEAIQVSHVPNLFVITTGMSPTSLVSLLNSHKMRELADTMKNWFDVVIFDCPPILGASDALVVSALVEGSIIVTQHRKFPRSMLVRVKGTLENFGTKCLGVVLNNVDIKHDNAYQYFSKYGQYYSKPKSKAKAPVEELAAETVTEDAY